jgi:hypothetical protein
MGNSFQVVTLIVSVILAVGYTSLVVLRKKDIPVSVSSMVYEFKGAWRWSWTIWLWVVSFTLAPSLIESIDESWQFVGFFTILCLVVTGALPIFTKEHKTAHDIFGFMACPLSQLCMCNICAWWALAWLLLPLIVWYYYKKDRIYKFLESLVFFAEAISALALYGALFFH